MSRADWLPEESAGRIRAIKGFAIKQAYFATDPVYADGSVYLLHWIGVDGEGNAYAPEGFHPSWPSPRGFTSMDGGKTIQHPEGFKLRNNGLLGRLAKAIFEITEGATPDPLTSFSPLQASGYVGMAFDLEEVAIDYGKEVGVKTRLMPTAFLGAGGGTVEDAGTTRKKVENLAKAAATFEEFRAGALAIPGVSSDSTLVTQVIDQASGIWSQVRG